MKYQTKPLQWFMERIGKRIYRDSNECPCDMCEDIEENGLVILDEQHAGTLCDTDNDYAAEGIYLNYRDEK